MQFSIPTTIYYALPNHTAGEVAQELNKGFVSADTDSSRIVRVDFPESFSQPLRKELIWNINEDIQASGISFSSEGAAKYL